MGHRNSKNESSDESADSSSSTTSRVQKLRRWRRQRLRRHRPHFHRHRCGSNSDSPIGKLLKDGDFAGISLLHIISAEMNFKDKWLACVTLGEQTFRTAISDHTDRPVWNSDLERSKPVVLTGDLNCAHQEIDIWNPAGNKRCAGFTDEERQSIQTNFLDKGFVDTFRKQNPNIVGYTYWGYRHGGRKANKGWRLDYFLASESIANQAYDSYILPDVSGSDHSPIGFILKL